MKRSSATAIVLALVAALLTLLAPGWASATGHRSQPIATSPALHQRVVATTIGLHVAPTARIVGEPRALVVTVRPRVSRFVKVQQLRGGRWSTVGHGRTMTTGRLRLSLRAPASLVTYYRAVAPRLRTRHTIYSAKASARSRITRQLQHVTIGFPASVVAGTSVTVRMRALPVRVGRAVRLQRDTDAGWRSTGNLKRENSSGRTSFTLPTSTPGSVRLRVMVRARHGARTVASAARVLTVGDSTPPSTPANLSGAPLNQSASLTWSAVSDPDLDHYRVYVATTPGDWSAAAQQPGSATTDTVTGLQNGTTYYFAVTAVDASGNESANSNVVSLTPTPCPPVGVVSAGGARPAAPRVAAC